MILHIINVCLDFRPVDPSSIVRQIRETPTKATCLILKNTWHYPVEPEVLRLYFSHIPEHIHSLDLSSWNLGHPTLIRALPSLPSHIRELTLHTQQINPNYEEPPRGRIIGNSLPHIIKFNAVDNRRGQVVIVHSAQADEIRLYMGQSFLANYVRTEEQLKQLMPNVLAQLTLEYWLDDDNDTIKFLGFSSEANRYRRQFQNIYQSTVFCIFALTASLVALSSLHTLPALIGLASIYASIYADVIILDSYERLKYENSKTWSLMLSILLTITLGCAKIIIANFMTLLLPIFAIECLVVTSVAGLAYAGYRFFQLKNPKFPKDEPELASSEEEKENKNSTLNDMGI